MARRYVYEIVVVSAKEPLGANASLVEQGVPLKVAAEYAKVRRHFSGLRRYVKTVEAKN